MPSGSAPRRWAGIAWANEPSGRGWTPIFGGSSASATSATIVRSASWSRSSSGGIAASTSAPTGTEGGRSDRPWRRVYRRVACDPCPRKPRQSLDNLSLERDAVLLYDALAAIEKEPKRPPRSGGSRPTSGATPTSGRASSKSAARRCRPGRHAPAARRGDHPARPAVRDRAVSDLVTALEGDEEEIYESQSSPEVAAIAADEPSMPRSGSN